MILARAVGVKGIREGKNGRRERSGEKYIGGRGTARACAALALPGQVKDAEKSAEAGNKLGGDATRGGAA